MLSVNGLIIMFMFGVLMTHVYYFVKVNLMNLTKKLIDLYLYRVCTCHYNGETKELFERSFCNFMRSSSDKLYYRLRFIEHGI